MVVAGSGHSHVWVMMHAHHPLRVELMAVDHSFVNGLASWIDAVEVWIHGEGAMVRVYMVVPHRRLDTTLRMLAVEAQVMALMVMVHADWLYELVVMMMRVVVMRGLVAANRVQLWHHILEVHVVKGVDVVPNRVNRVVVHEGELMARSALLVGFLPINVGDARCATVSWLIVLFLRLGLLLLLLLLVLLCSWLLLICLLSSRGVVVVIIALWLQLHGLLLQFGLTSVFFLFVGCRLVGFVRHVLLILLHGLLASLEGCCCCC